MILSPSYLPNRLRLLAAGQWSLSLLLAVVTLLGGSNTVRAQLPGTINPSFAPLARPDGTIASISTQPDGKLVLGGNFLRVGSTISPHVCRLNVDGSVDASFTPPANLGQIVYLATGSDGKTALVEMSNNDYPATYTLLRLNADGSQDASFTPAAFLGSPNTGDVRAFTVAVQADDKVLVEGEFYRTSGVGPSIERFNADGSLDTAFQYPSHLSTSTLSALLPLSNGQVLVGGNVVDYGGQSYAYRTVFILNADGSVDEGYNPDTTGVQTVYALALQADGKVVYLGYSTPADPLGGFSFTGGVPRRLNADGTADTSFAPQLASGATLTSLLIQPDGKVLASGYTANYLVTTDPSSSIEVVQNGVVRLNTDGTTDTNFTPAVPLVDDQVNALGLLPNGQIIVGGSFDTVASLNRIGLARLNADGTADASYVNDLTDVGIAYAVAVQASGLPLLLDSVSFVPSVTASKPSKAQPALEIIKSPVPSQLASFNTDGSLNTVFEFATASGEAGYLNPVSTTFNLVTSTQPAYSVLAQQLDGKVLVTGNFTNQSSYEFSQVERFNLDGSLDTNFNYIAVPDNYESTYAVLPQADGTIFIAGNAGYYENASYPLTRLKADGSYDSTFAPAADPGASESYLGSTFYSLALQTDGKVIAGGALSPVNAQPVADVLRFNSGGSVDTGFNAAVPTETADGQAPYVFALALQADGKVIVGGHFSAFGGIPCSNLARLNTDGSLDTGFDAGGLGTNGLVRAIAIQTDGKIVLGGEFTQVNGVALQGVARLNTDGTVDPLFFPGVGTGGTGVVNSLALAPDGSILIGGTFTAFDGQPRDGAAELTGGELTAPVITATLATAQVGQPFTYPIPASEQPTGYTAMGLPDGLFLATSGIISGTPTKTGTFTVALTATNAAGTGTGSLAITVNPPTPAVSGGIAAGQVGVAFNYPVNATNSPVSYAAAVLPAGLIINPSTGLISGTPTVSGTFAVTLSAANAGGTGTATLTLTIAPPPTVTIAALGDTDAVEGGENGKVAIRRDGDLSNALTVHYKVVGNVVAGKDYKPVTGVATIPAGAAQVKIKIKPINDTTLEGTRVAKVKLKPASDGSYTLGSPTVAKVHVIDND